MLAETKEAPATTRFASLQNVCTPVLATLPSVAATRMIVRRVRHEIQAPPPIPQSLAQLVLPLNYQRYTRTEEINEQFLMADSGVMDLPGSATQHRIFGCEKMRNLAHQMNHIYVDGSFAIIFAWHSNVLALKCSGT